MNKVTEWSEEELEELWQTLEGMYSLETLRIHTQHEFPGDDRLYEVPRNILDYMLPTPVLEEGEDFAKRRRNLAGTPWKSATWMKMVKGERNSQAMS